MFCHIPGTKVPMQLTKLSKVSSNQFVQKVNCGLSRIFVEKNPGGFAATN